MDKALFEGVIRDGLLDQLDGDRRLVDAEHAGRLAGRGTDASGELGEVVGGVQLANRIAPLAVEDEVIPIGDEIGEGAAGMAERDAAIHAAGALRFDTVVRKGLVYLEPVFDPLLGVAARRDFARIFEEPGDFTHGSPRSQ